MFGNWPSLSSIFEGQNDADLHDKKLKRDRDEPEDWGFEVHKTLLSFGIEKPTQIPEASSKLQRIVFQRKLLAITEAPSNYVNPFTETIDKCKVNFESNELDRCAAQIMMEKLPGVSRWKPNLVPRMVSEADFFSNIFSYVAATSAEHYNEESTLKYFYEDDEEEKLEQPKPTLASEDKLQNKNVVPQIDVTFNSDNSKAKSRFGEHLPRGADNDSLKQQFKNESIFFFIEKSTNRNTVVYKANIDSSGKLRANDPIRPVWITYENPSAVKEEELTMMERISTYGASVVPINDKPGHFLVSIGALKQRPVEIWVDNSGFLHALTKCNGKPDELYSVYVNVVNNWVGLPSVEYTKIRSKSGSETISGV
mmetsp:Transcript_16195/g.18326  ORF Transcript_16195/g.18326 Transcript_16195/m.18326 type:complete len:367 (-) Transcript_16195:40-1140(-)